MSGVSRESFGKTVSDYEAQHAGDVKGRRLEYATLVNRYYDLATDFYMFGWGDHFHFAPRMKGEAFKASLKRHERFLASKLQLGSGRRCLDVGCGVGGPARYIARFTNANVVGVNNNAYQIETGRKLTTRAGLSHLVDFCKADFMKLPMADASFDAVYTIEASCHAPDRVELFKELLRVMKPGALFAGYEWCLTDRYDESRADHQKIKKDIEVGNGLPDLAHTSVVDAALEAAGFELQQALDVADMADEETPWYLPLTGEEKGIRALPRRPIGRKITNLATRALEALRLAPEGTSRVSDFLNAGADALVAGGKTGTFTPMYFFVAQKPA